MWKKLGVIRKWIVGIALGDCYILEVFNVVNHQRSRKMQCSYKNS